MNLTTGSSRSFSLQRARRCGDGFVFGGPKIFGPIPRLRVHTGTRGRLSSRSVPESHSRLACELVEDRRRLSKTVIE
jgi:hypothetical protein